MNQTTLTPRIHAVVIQESFKRAMRKRRETSYTNDADMHRYSGFLISEIVVAVIDVVFEGRTISRCDAEVVGIEADYSNEHDGVHVDIQYFNGRADITAKEAADALAEHLGVKVTCDVSEKADSFISG